jgi:hypothetical protein
MPYRTSYRWMFRSTERWAGRHGRCLARVGGYAALCRIPTFNFRLNLPSTSRELQLAPLIPLKADEHWAYFSIRPGRGKAWMPSGRCDTGVCRQLFPENTSSAQCHGFFGRILQGKKSCLLYFGRSTKSESPKRPKPGLSANGNTPIIQQISMKAMQPRCWVTIPDLLPTYPAINAPLCAPRCPCRSE